MPETSMAKVSPNCLKVCIIAPRKRSSEAALTSTQLKIRYIRSERLLLGSCIAIAYTQSRFIRPKTRLII